MCLFPNLWLKNPHAWRNLWSWFIAAWALKFINIFAFLFAVFQMVKSSISVIDAFYV